MPTLETEEVPQERWTAWSALLSPGARYKLAAGRAIASPRGGGLLAADTNHAEALHDLAVELRDRLRFSQNRVSALKSELEAVEQRAAEYKTILRQRAEAELASIQQRATAQLASVQQQAAQMLAATEAAAARDRAASEARLSEFQTQITRIHEQVTAQAEALEEQEAANADLSARLEAAEEARDAAQAEAAAIQDATADARDQLGELAEEAAALRQALAAAQAKAEVSRDGVVQAERKQGELVAELLRAKADAAALSQLDAKYQLARDEVARLEAENQELRDMLIYGPASLAASPHIRSAHSTPEAPGKRRGAAAAGMRASPYAARASHARRVERAAVSRDVLFEFGDALGTRDPHTAPSTRPRSPTGRPRSAGARPATSAEVSAATTAALGDLAWLGQPSSAYPPGPEQFEFVRVAGGFGPRLVGVAETPKASGWVPKQVVRVAQAFRQAHGLTQPPWQAWEPFLLLVDDAYRAAGALRQGRKHAPHTDSSLAAGPPPQTSSPPLDTPLASVVQAARIAFLKKQLNEALEPKGRGARTSPGPRRTRAARLAEDVVRQMARKDYHLFNQLDRALDDNVHLKTSTGGVYTGSAGEDDLVTQLQLMDHLRAD